MIGRLYEVNTETPFFEVLLPSNTSFGLNFELKVHNIKTGLRLRARSSLVIILA